MSSWYELSGRHAQQKAAHPYGRSLAAARELVGLQSGDPAVEQAADRGRASPAPRRTGTSPTSGRCSRRPTRSPTPPSLLDDPAPEDPRAAPRGRRLDPDARADVLRVSLSTGRQPRLSLTPGATVEQLPAAGAGAASEERDAPPPAPRPPTTERPAPSPSGRRRGRGALLATDVAGASDGGGPILRRSAPRSLRRCGRRRRERRRAARPPPRLPRSGGDLPPFAQAQVALDRVGLPDHGCMGAVQSRVRG